MECTADVLLSEKVTLPPHPEWASITPPTAAPSLAQFYLWIIQNTLSDSLIMQDEQETEKT